MRAYTVTTVAVTLNVPSKWLDNVLSHHTVPGVAKTRQGVARRLTQEAVVVLAIALMLSGSLAISVPRALEIAQELRRAGGSKARYVLDGGTGELLFDVTAIESDISDRLAEAVEIAPTPRRGRPPLSPRKISL